MCWSWIVQHTDIPKKLKSFTKHADAVVQLVHDEWWVPIGPTTLKYEHSTYVESYNFIAQAEDPWIPKL